MIPILADIQVSNTQMGVFIGCLTVFLVLMGKIGELKKNLITDVLAAAGVQRATETAGHLPQPFITAPREVFVERAGFHKHAEINRGEHSRIEMKFDDAIAGINEAVRQISIQVAETKVLRESNGKAIDLLTETVGEARDNISELSGAVHQALKHQPKTVRRARRKA